MSTIEDLEGILRANGFVKCDIPACNCGLWHQIHGWPERVKEIEDMLDEAGYPLSNNNGNLVKNALQELIDERDRLKHK